MALLRSILVILLLISAARVTIAQESTVYLSVITTKVFVVGGANLKTGMFFQRPHEDTVWRHSGAKNIRAFDVAVDGSSRGESIYIASGNGVHRTTNGGKDWRITTDWRITEVQTVAVDPANPMIVYAGTPYGIVKTTDGGETWRKKNIGLHATFVFSIIVDQKNPARLLCSTEDGLYQSEDGAEQWVRTGLNVGGAREIAQHPKDADILFVATENNGLYYSTNRGKYWEKSEAGIDHQTFYTITFDPSRPEVLYAGGYVTGVYKSVDGGRSWKRMNEGLTTLHVYAIAVDPTNSQRVYAATFGGGIFRSDDEGQRWRNVGLIGSQVSSITIHPF